MGLYLPKFAKRIQLGDKKLKFLKLTNLMRKIEYLNKLSKFPTQIVKGTPSCLKVVSKPTIAISKPSFKAN